MQGDKLAACTSTARHDSQLKARLAAIRASMATAESSATSCVLQLHARGCLIQAAPPGSAELRGDVVGGYPPTGTSGVPPSIALAVSQAPGVPLVRLRPEQASPVSHVPPPPVPQQGWPAAPQAAQTLPEAPSTHACGVVQAVTPLSAAPGPPPTGQQS